MTCTDIEILYLVCILVEDACHGSNVCLSKVYHIDIVTDACSVRSVIVVTEDGKFLADTHSGLGYERNEVVWNTVWQLTNEC